MSIKTLSHLNGHKSLSCDLCSGIINSCLNDIKVINMHNFRIDFSPFPPFFTFIISSGYVFFVVVKNIFSIQTLKNTMEVSKCLKY